MDSCIKLKLVASHLQPIYADADMSARSPFNDAIYHHHHHQHHHHLYPRSQSARTYLERHLDSFPACDVDALVRHALRALRDCLPGEAELSQKNVCLSIVGGDRKFTTYEEDAVRPFLDAIDEDGDGDAVAVDTLPDAPTGGLDAPAAAAAPGEAAMEVAPE